jgi:hypothetical protein
MGECQEGDDEAGNGCDPLPPPPGGICASATEPPDFADAVVFEVGGVARAKMGVRGLNLQGELIPVTIQQDGMGNKLDIVFELGPEPIPPVDEHVYPRSSDVGACCTPDEAVYTALDLDMISEITEVARQDCGVAACLQLYEELVYQSQTYDDPNIPPNIGLDFIEENTRQSFAYFAGQLENPNFFDACRAKALELVEPVDPMDPGIPLTVVDIDAWSGFEDETLPEQFVLSFNGYGVEMAGSLKEAYLAYACEVDVGPAPYDPPQVCDANPNFDADQFPGVAGDRGGGEIEGGLAVVMPNGSSLPFDASSYELEVFGCGLLTCPVTLRELDLRSSSVQVGPFKLISPEAHLVGLALGTRDGDSLRFESASIAMELIVDVRVGPMHPFGPDPVTIVAYNDGPMLASLVDGTFEIQALDFLIEGVGPNMERLRVTTEPAPFELEE